MSIDAGCASVSASVYRSFYDTLMISLRQYLVTYISLLLLLRLFCAILMLLSNHCLVTLTSLLLRLRPFYATLMVIQFNSITCIFVDINVTIQTGTVKTHKKKSEKRRKKTETKTKTLPLLVRLIKTSGHHYGDWGGTRESVLLPWQT